MILSAQSIEQTSLLKMYCICTADLRFERLSAFLAEFSNRVRTRVAIDFPCIVGKIEYDDFGGCS